MWREEELKADSSDALTDSAFECARVRVHTQNEGSSVSACMCREMHPALTHAR